MPFVRVAAFVATHHEIEELRIRPRQQVSKSVERGIVEVLEMLFEECGQQEIELQQSAPAPPAYALTRAFDGGHTARFTMRSRILLMASVGLSPLGHTSGRFMIEWHRNRRYGSSRLSSRSLIATSRVSAMKRYAHKRPAGPTNLSGFHQKDV